LPADTTKHFDSLTVALLEPVSLANPRSPANDSERLLFRHLFHNLIRLDCQGIARPDIAATWRFHPDTGWTFTLQDWASRSPRSWMNADIIAASFDSAYVLDARHLTILKRGEDTIPRFLADPAAAVPQAGISYLDIERGGIHSSGPEGKAAVYFKYEANNDARDVLDRGADLLVTRDPAIADYVSNRAELATFPLPWSRTYVLAEQQTAQPLAASVSDSSVRRSLASDAVKAEARAADSLEWWSDAVACGRRSSPGAAGVSRRIVYPEGDSTARGLAERVVALVPASSGLRAAGLDTAEFAKAVRDGTERAYVLAVPRRSLAPCRYVAMWPAGATLTPLIDTRAFAIVRRGAPPLSVDWDGTLRILDP
jgi:hypothetical protein